MTQLEQDLELAYALIEDREKITKYYSQFYRIWPFTTVNMAEYLSAFDLENKSCATIQGSSDHIFELFLKNPQKILGIDTNPLTGHYGYLKMAAFGALSTPEEFLKFFRWNDYPKFCHNNYKAFDKDTFQEMTKYLSGDSKLFWEDLFRKYDPIKIRTNLFSKDEENNRAIAKALTYLTPENYAYIRNNIENMNYSFMCADVRELADTLSEKIDFLTLSNLIIYADSMFPDDPVQGYKYLVESLSRCLNDNGQIVAGYLYEIENEEDSRDIYKSAIRDAIFTGSEYYYHYVKSMQDLHRDSQSDIHDACLIYSR